MQALDLLPEKIGKEDELNKIYRENGFQRNKILFSLKEKGQLIAILPIIQSVIQFLLGYPGILHRISRIGVPELPLHGCNVSGLLN